MTPNISTVARSIDPIPRLSFKNRYVTSNNVQEVYTTPTNPHNVANITFHKPCFFPYLIPSANESNTIQIKKLI